MKLTEQQLAKIFRLSKDTEVGQHSVDFNHTVEASDARIENVEKIANNSTLSASYQIINKMDNWSKSVANDLNNKSKPKLTANIFAWLKPTLATAAVLTAVYFVTPVINKEPHSQIIIQTLKPDRIMYSSSFENSKATSKDCSETQNSDVIAKFDFS